MRLLELKITLLDVQPPVWRKVLVRPELTLGSLHGVLQVVMGWKNMHLHRFRAGDRSYSDPQFELEGGARDEGAVQLGDLLSVPGSQLLYEYDFGDGWQHEVRCESSVESGLDSLHAVCTSGGRACPPEDCGGAPGYAEFLRALSGNRGRRNAELRAWAPRRFDPEAFSSKDANAALARVSLRKPTKRMKVRDS